MNKQKNDGLSAYGFNLFQNYPNPFNPETEIKYYIPKDSKINIKVYDVTGKIIDELVNEYKTIGSHSVHFNSSNLSSGIYYYQIIAFDNYGNETIKISRKMILIK